MPGGWHAHATRRPFKQQFSWLRCWWSDDDSSSSSSRRTHHLGPTLSETDRLVAAHLTAGGPTVGFDACARTDQAGVDIINIQVHSYSKIRSDDVRGECKCNAARLTLRMCRDSRRGWCVPDKTIANGEETAINTEEHPADG
jgi:hypothetical protein